MLHLRIFAALPAVLTKEKELGSSRVATRTKLTKQVNYSIFDALSKTNMGIRT